MVVSSRLNREKWSYLFNEEKEKHITIHRFTFQIPTTELGWAAAETEELFLPGRQQGPK